MVTRVDCAPGHLSSHANRPKAPHPRRPPAHPPACPPAHPPPPPPSPWGVGGAPSACVFSTPLPLVLAPVSSRRVPVAVVTVHRKALLCVRARRRLQPCVRACDRERGWAHGCGAQASSSLEFTPAAEITARHARAQAFFRAGRSRPYAWRVEQLKALRRMMSDNLEEVTAALAADLSKSKCVFAARTPCPSLPRQPRVGPPHSLLSAHVHPPRLPSRGAGAAVVAEAAAAAAWREQGGDGWGGGGRGTAQAPSTACG